MVKGWDPFHQSGVESVSRTPKRSIATGPVSFLQLAIFYVSDLETKTFLSNVGR